MAGPLAVPDAWRLVAGGYAQHLTDLFSFYAAHALDLADVGPSSQVVDVATGPGTLALLAAPRVAHVDALDFAPEMLDALCARAAATAPPLSNLSVHLGDGQALPFASHRYDAAFSLFGLMFFPDRARGLQELRRVLRPGGRAVISAWPPLDTVPVMAALVQTLTAVLPPSAVTTAPAVVPALAPPLSTPEVMRAELAAAGFHDVTIHLVTQTAEVHSADAFWDVHLASSAPLALQRRSMSPEDFSAFSVAVRERLRERLGTAPFSMSWPALVGMGHA